MRLFAALRPSTKTLRALSRMQKGVSGAKWSDIEKFHITLAFFGDVAEEQAELLDGRLGDIRQPGFDVSYASVGHYGKDRPYNLHVGVALTLELEHLHKACLRAARAVGIDIERRDYRPHVTMAYIRGAPRIDRIVAWEKNYHGNLYRLEASYPLRGEMLPPTA